MVAALGVVTVTGTARAGNDGTDFGPQVRTLFRVAACGGDDAIPARFAARTIDSHCHELAAVYASYRKAWATGRSDSSPSCVRADLPHTVVYPFGGGDLSSALAVYPDATEMTTISLEAAGDIRAIDSIPRVKLASDLDAITDDLRRLYHAAHSTTQSLQEASHSLLPGTIMMALAGLAVHDMEPVVAALLRHPARRLAALPHRRGARHARGRARGSQARREAAEASEAFLVRAELGVRERRDPVPATG